MQTIILQYSSRNIYDNDGMEKGYFIIIWTTNNNT